MENLPSLQEKNNPPKKTTQMSMKKTLKSEDKALSTVHYIDVFLFPVLQATENLPSLEEKKQTPEKKINDSNVHEKDIKIIRQGFKHSALYWCSQ